MVDQVSQQIKATYSVRGSWKRSLEVSILIAEEKNGGNWELDRVNMPVSM